MRLKLLFDRNSEYNRIKSQMDLNRYQNRLQVDQSSFSIHTSPNKPDFLSKRTGVGLDRTGVRLKRTGCCCCDLTCVLGSSARPPCGRFLVTSKDPTMRIIPEVTELSHGSTQSEQVSGQL